jgi:hypothetical protein
VLGYANKSVQEVKLTFTYLESDMPRMPPTTTGTPEPMHYIYRLIVAVVIGHFYKQHYDNVTLPNREIKMANAMNYLEKLHDDAYKSVVPNTLDELQIRYFIIVLQDIESKVIIDRKKAVYGYEASKEWTLYKEAVIKDLEKSSSTGGSNPTDSSSPVGSTDKDTSTGPIPEPPQPTTGQPQPTTGQPTIVDMTPSQSPITQVNGTSSTKTGFVPLKENDKLKKSVLTLVKGGTAFTKKDEAFVTSIFDDPALNSKHLFADILTPVTNVEENTVSTENKVDSNELKFRKVLAEELSKNEGMFAEKVSLSGLQTVRAIQTMDSAERTNLNQKIVSEFLHIVDSVKILNDVLFFGNVTNNKSKKEGDANTLALLKSVVEKPRKVLSDREKMKKFLRILPDASSAKLIAIDSGRGSNVNNETIANLFGKIVALQKADPIASKISRGEKWGNIPKLKPEDKVRSLSLTGDAMDGLTTDQLYSNGFAVMAKKDDKFNYDKLDRSLRIQGFFAENFETETPDIYRIEYYGKETAATLYILDPTDDAKRDVYVELRKSFKDDEIVFRKLQFRAGKDTILDDSKFAQIVFPKYLGYDDDPKNIRTQLAGTLSPISANVKMVIEITNFDYTHALTFLVLGTAVYVIDHDARAISSIDEVFDRSGSPPPVYISKQIFTTKWEYLKDYVKEVPMEKQYQTQQISTIGGKVIPSMFSSEETTEVQAYVQTFNEDINDFEIKSETYKIRGSVTKANILEKYQELTPELLRMPDARLYKVLKTYIPQDATETQPGWINALSWTLIDSSDPIDDAGNYTFLIVQQGFFDTEATGSTSITGPPQTEGQPGLRVENVLENEITNEIETLANSE